MVQGCHSRPVQKPAGNLEETLWPLPGSRWEEGGCLPGCMLCTSLLFRPHSPCLRCPPKQVSTPRPRRGKSTRAHSLFLLLVISCPRPHRPAFPPRPDQSVPAAGQPSPRSCRQTTGHLRRSPPPRIYPSGPWRAGFSVMVWVSKAYMP